MNGMKILIITRNAWDDTNSIGNTISNFFGGLEGIEFANIYFRSQKPNNPLCKKYFRVTEKDILKNFFNSEKIGKAFEYSANENRAENSISSEKKLISAIHKYNLNIFYTLSDKLWNSKKWINKKLYDFINDFNPDLIFTFAKSAPQYFLTLEYLHKNFNKKTVLWIADDEFTALKKAKNKKSKRDLQRLEYILSTADKVYGCSNEICTFYNGIFDCNATPHYKSCRFDYPVRKTVNSPLKIVYAGNLLFGRDKTLCEIIEKLKIMNTGENRFFLEIYSGNYVTDELKNRLTVSGVSEFCGKRPYGEIQRIFNNSDMVLLIESFEEEEKAKTRYSFSTKIIDALQSGSSILAVGPDDISSIRYLNSVSGSIVINGLSDFESKMSYISENPEILIENAEKIREFALTNHKTDNSWLNA